MKEVLKHIFDRKRAYARLPLFEWMRNSALGPADRLAFYPCMAHFIMTFGDLNKFVLREQHAADPYQEMVNNHTLEDDHHWPWYLEDFRKLGFDEARSGTEWMRFLWSEETKQNRILSARLTAVIKGTSGLERLAIVEAIEETGNVLFSAILPLAQAIEREQGVQLRYCGDFHFSRESGHAVNADHAALVGARLTQAERVHYKELVDDVFAWFTDWTHELLRYALANPTHLPAPGAERSTSRSDTWPRADLGHDSVPESKTG